MFLLSIACGFVWDLCRRSACGRRHCLQDSRRVRAIRRKISSRTRGILVAAQLALSVVLLVGAGLTLRTLLQLEHTDGGFSTGGVTTARIYMLKSNQRAFYDSLLERTQPARGCAVGAPCQAPSRCLTGRRPQLRLSPGSERRRSGQIAETRLRQCARHQVPDISRPSECPCSTGATSMAATPNRLRWWSSSTSTWPNTTGLWEMRWEKKSHSRARSGQPIVGVVSDVRQYGLDKEPVDEAYCAFAQTHNNSMSLLCEDPPDWRWLRRSPGSCTISIPTP